jgi:precorrin-3B synthase
MSAPEAKDPEIKGWCPGALRPMLSGDGWVVRVRPPEGRLSHAQVDALADLAETCGNRFLQLTNRANIQLRGVMPGRVGALVKGLAAVGLVDPALSDATEARLNILVTPGWHRPEPPYIRFDTLKAWHLLRAALVAADAPDLPGKFGFALDTGFRNRHLALDSADIRIESAWDDVIVRADGMAQGRRVADEAEAVAVAMDMARWFVDTGGVGPDRRGRMRDHIARDAVLPAALAGEVEPSSQATPPTIWSNLVYAALGQMSARSLRSLKAHCPVALRVTPWRAFHLPVITGDRALRRRHSLIRNPADPRLSVVACPGGPMCPQGRGPTRRLARSLAGVLPPGEVLHVSGCAKGCAHPGPAAVTLVAAGGGRYALVRNGSAADPPERLVAASALPSALRDPDPHAAPL